MSKDSIKIHDDMPPERSAPHEAIPEPTLYIPSEQLRWCIKDGQKVLQQMHTDMRTGQQVWWDVPIVIED